MKQLIKYISLFAVAILATACVTPAYKTSKGIIPDKKYRHVSKSDTTTIAAINWREYYGDTHLQALIEQALDSNLNLRIKIKQMEEARSYYKMSRLSFFPTLNIGAQAALSDPSKFGSQSVASGQLNKNFSLTASASWEIDIWGKLNSAKRAAYARMLTQQATKNAVVTQLIADVATAYYQLLTLDAQLDISKQTVENYTEYLGTVKALKESAEVNEVAVQQAYAQLYGVKAYIPELTSAIEVTENYLCLLLGKPGQKIERAHKVDLESIKTNEQVGMPAQLLQYRPDVMAAEYTLRASHEQFNVAKAAMYPNLTLSGSIGAESLKVDNWFNLPSSLFWNAVAGLTQPVFNGRALRTEKEVARLQNEEAYLAFRQQVLLATSEVSNALLKCNTTSQRAIFQKEQYQALAKAYEYSQLLLVRGYASYLDVLTAQSGVFSTQISLYDTYLEIMKQKIELYRALGGGWQN